MTHSSETFSSSLEQPPGDPEAHREFSPEEKAIMTGLINKGIEELEQQLKFHTNSKNPFQQKLEQDLRTLHALKSRFN